ncbi:MAG: hypothetical protein AAF664_22500 [Planctomycetota bacterium]
MGQARVRQWLKIAWASPYTLLGLTLGVGGLLFGGKAKARGGVIEFYEGGVKWMIHRLPQGQWTLAFTLGHTILGQTEASIDVARAHERVHVAQYERWGPFMLPVYYACSVFVWMRGGHFYRDNPFEREASDDQRE